MQAALISPCTAGIAPSRFQFFRAVPFPEVHPLFFRHPTSQLRNGEIVSRHISLNPNCTGAMIVAAITDSLLQASRYVLKGGSGNEQFIGRHPRFMRRVTPILRRAFPPTMQRFSSAMRPKTHTAILVAPVGVEPTNRVF